MSPSTPRAPADAGGPSEPETILAAPVASKVAALEGAIGELGHAVVACSGGVDSTFLAEAAHRVLGSAAVAVTADSPSLPRRELQAVRALAARRGWRHVVVETDELDDERYAANPTNRCWFCKSALLDRLTPVAAANEGAPVLIGTVVDDLGDWRPGLAASRARGARQPLLDAGFTKAEVRLAARFFGLPTADKPAAACLASRFAYGVRISAAGLRRVERAEELVRGRGFRIVRVRDLGAARARVEVGPAEVPRLLAGAADIRRDLTALGFAHVALDPGGYRRGALNEGVVG